MSARQRDPLDRLVDFAFGVPIAGAAFARDITKFAAHQAVDAARTAGSTLAVLAVDRQAARAEPFGTIDRPSSPSTAFSSSASSSSTSSSASSSSASRSRVAGRVGAGRSSTGVRDEGLADLDSGAAGAGVTSADLDEELAADADTDIDADIVMAIDGYDELSARQIVELLDGLTDDELTEIELFERDGRGRRTILAKIDAVRAGRTAD